MVTGEILLGIPYYWYYRHYTIHTYPLVPRNYLPLLPTIL